MQANEGKWRLQENEEKRVLKGIEEKVEGHEIKTMRTSKKERCD